MKDNEFKVDIKYNNKILKYFIEDTLKFSSRKIKKLLKEKKITVNGKHAYWDTKLKTGDVVYICLAEKVNEDIIPENIPLSVIFEDDFVLAVNKPPYMLVHPTSNHKSGTLANALKYYYLSNNINQNIRFFNRLDMNTSGVVIIPKTGETHSLLMKMADEGSIQKSYIAVVEGVIEKDSDIINEPIGKDSDDPIRRKVIAGGQKAITKYRVIKRLKSATIVELELITGRTHQIRVHLGHIGYPIIGDVLYGKGSKLIQRQALHAAKVMLIHPVSHLPLCLEAKLPGDIEELIEILDKVNK